jgi:hypothetical protein
MILYHSVELSLLSRYSIMLHYTVYMLRDKRDNSTLWYSIILQFTLYMLRDKSDNSTLRYYNLFLFSKFEKSYERNIEERDQRENIVEEVNKDARI